MEKEELSKSDKEWLEKAKKEANELQEQNRERNRKRIKGKNKDKN